MSTRMTPEQAVEFCKAAALGIACGLQHRFEWYVNAVRATTHGDYSTINERRKAIADAFMAFEKTTACCLEETRELESMTLDEFVTKVDKWYSKGR